ncbi:symmetrical bis(5'-nucleosyl)-tetraphosphatase [Thauera sp. CAU 1555]|uniref:Bis(5'-nucleosyl)-tetraphosphatase, symmetrical n=1 Tax=Thauera sedimentorum TaxID=2767595 RepID=A0ABR9B4K1_9RHOO|nr:symmetrical bis(5'-nucleosyl)-tetraphosphatase [Thauera sedimentorum]MBC9070374.1 symmetrical bis(5'-nucleosyl)-tetraphosphatase [Thauera sedimentorum]MBD8501294.1 symmetrical bis(5'-nucleosyl)-tetraphosphatase [Thauera sedimentorum]
MATYAIGDVQGCYREFRDLLDKIQFDPARDRLWLVGDLVNRGPASLETLRFVRSLGESAITVLGNHDLYLLKLAYSGAAGRKRADTLQQVLEAKDRDDLVDWLRKRPLMHLEDGFAMVHAGLLPGWSVTQARVLAEEVENLLAGPDWGRLMDHLWGNQPRAWDSSLKGWDRIRVIVNAMTRMRFCSRDGQMEFDTKGVPEKAPFGHIPWFAHPARASTDTTIVFGHWSALGLKITDNLMALDTGCIWGEKLTAICLETREPVQIQAGKGLVQR